MNLTGWCLGSLLVIVAQGPASSARPKPAQRVLTWNVDGVPQRMTVLQDDGPVLPSKEPDTRIDILSVIGPMVTTRFMQTWMGDSGGYITESMRVEYRGKYRFSLGEYLEETRQGGRVLAAILKMPDVPSKERCPSPSMVKEQPSFTKGREQLLTAGCAHPKWLTLEPEAFSILNWDDEDKVLLAIQTFHPEGMRSSNRMERVGVWLTAPPEWRPWLEAARRGEGLFEDQRDDWVRRLSPRELATVRARVTKLKHTARRKFIAETVYRAQQAPLSAADLVDEFFPEPKDGGLDLDTQWAWSDRVLYLRHTPRCRKAAEVVLREQWAPETAKAIVFNLTQCGGFYGQAPPKGCVEHAAPASCIKPWVEAQQEQERSASQFSPVNDREGSAPAE